jgi:hypothetical protein
MSDWTRRSRNLSFATLLIVFFSFRAPVVLADAFECVTIEPIELNQECLAGPVAFPNCWSMFSTFADDWCPNHVDDTCGAYCGGSGNVVDSNCWFEGNAYYGGQHALCSNQIYIWCQCSEV